MPSYCTGGTGRVRCVGRDGAEATLAADFRPVAWFPRHRSSRKKLLGRPRPAYGPVTDYDVTLPPELERFAAEAVAAGRYRDMAEVVAAGVQLLEQRDRARAAFAASAIDAQQEAERVGDLTGDEVAERVRATIARKTSAAA